MAGLPALQPGFHRGKGTVLVAGVSEDTLRRLKDLRPPQGEVGDLALALLRRFLAPPFLGRLLYLQAKRSASLVSRRQVQE
jgi:hypothetical protein